MKNPIIISSAIAIGIILAGCSAPRLKSSVKESAPRASDWHVDFTGTGSGLNTDHTVNEPEGELTISDARRLVLHRSPLLEAFAWEVRRSEAMEQQAGVWNNPELEVEWMDIESPEGDALETEVVLSQKIPLGRDIAGRRQLAAARKEVTNWEYEAARLEALYLVSSRFIDALAAERRLDLASRELELIRETEHAIRQLVDAGKISPVELLRIEVPLAQAELWLSQQERLVDAAYRMLALSWDSRKPSFDNVKGDLELISPPPDASRLVSLMNSNPDIASWSSRISEQVAARKIAVATAIPDPSLRIGFMERDQPDEEAMIVGIALPLPIFNHNQAGISASRQGEKAARARKAAAELRVEGLLNSAYTGLANAYDEVVVLRDRAIPSAEKGFAAIKTAFAEGKLSLLDVLDAQRTLFEIEGRYLDALTTFHLKTLEIESLTGTSLADMATAR